MTNLAFLLPLASLVLWTASAQVPVSIPILNPTFADDQLECSPGGNCAFTGITGWLSGPQTAIAKYSTVQYSIAPVTGIHLAALGNSNATGSILQTLGATLQANTTYVLKVTVGARADYPFTGYEAELLAGNVILIFGNKATPVGGSFTTEELTYNSGAAPAQLGQALQIFVRSLGTGQVSVAAVTLTAQ